MLIVSTNNLHYEMSENNRPLKSLSQKSDLLSQKTV